ncbi:MAG TPA: magnesium/cobalt transporter CorA [Fimbriimonas sp.]|nr:magnesium/cobalt transporter CorA [Fimbriimonas sp.]
MPQIEIRAAAERGKGCTLVSTEEAVRLLHDKKNLVWVDLLATNLEDARMFLLDQLGFHELAVEDALSDYERPTLQEFDHYLFFSAPALLHPEADSETTEVGFFLTSNALVTVAKARIKVIDEWFGRWQAHPETMDHIPAVLLHSILDGLVDSYFPVVDAMEDRMDELSDSIFGGNTGRVKDVLVLKKQFLDFRRRIVPTRDILNSLLRRDLTLIPLSTKPYFQDVLDHVLRINEVLEVNRDTLASLLDVHLAQVSNNMNLVLKKMTVVATVLMVMTLIAGIYGMNFRFMPELHWVYGYPFALGLMLFSAAAVLWVFKLFKWV